VLAKEGAIGGLEDVEKLAERDMGLAVDVKASDAGNFEELDTAFPGTAATAVFVTACELFFAGAKNEAMDDCRDGAIFCTPGLTRSVSISKSLLAHAECCEGRAGAWACCGAFGRTTMSERALRGISSVSIGSDMDLTSGKCERTVVAAPRMTSTSAILALLDARLRGVTADAGRG
jgi:hypothetical protein